MAAVSGTRSPTAASTTVDTQPSTRASSSSSRASAAFCSGVSRGVKAPSWSRPSSAPGFMRADGSRPCAASSMADMSMVMPRAYASTAS